MFIFLLALADSQIKIQMFFSFFHRLYIFYQMRFSFDFSFHFLKPIFTNSRTNERPSDWRYNNLQGAKCTEFFYNDVTRYSDCRFNDLWSGKCVSHYSDFRFEGSGRTNSNC